MENQHYQILELYEEKTFLGNEAMKEVAETIALSPDGTLETELEQDGLLHVLGTRFYLRKVETSEPE